MSQFEPIDDQTFRYQAGADLVYPLEGEGERYRLEWLEQYLTDNGLCSNGYEITKRTPVVTSPGVHLVYYEGKCI